MSRPRFPEAFRALIVGSAVSNVGDGVRMTALPLLAVVLTDSKLLVALVTAAQFLPWLVFGPIAGTAVDRCDRRKLIFRTQWARAAIMAALAIAVAAGFGAMWQIYLVAFLITAGEILVDPALIAMVPTLVSDDELDAANGRLMATHLIGNEFAGSALGSLLFTVAPWLPFAVDGATYGASTERFRLLPERRPTSGQAVARVRHQIAEGFRFLRGHEVLWPMAIAGAVRNFGAIGAYALLVVLYIDELGGSEVGFGLLLAAGALGAATGSMLVDRLAAVARSSVVLAVSLVEGAGMIGLAFAPSTLVAGALWFAVAMPFGVFLPIVLSVQQRACPDHLLGRINTTTRVLTRSAFLVGAIAGGLLADLTSVRVVIVGGALVVMASGPLMARAVQDGRWSPDGVS